MALEWQKGNYFGCGRLLAFFLLFVPFFICLFFSKYILLLRVTTHFMFVNHSDHVPQSSSTMPSTEYTKALKREKLCIFSIFFFETWMFYVHNTLILFRAIVDLPGNEEKYFNCDQKWVILWAHLLLNGKYLRLTLWGVGLGVKECGNIQLINNGWVCDGFQIKLMFMDWI